MSLELLYTSAPQGLKQGSRGFCTVISTAGMPINIAQKLESLSGYRHLYPPNDPQSNRNPVAYSHFRFQVGGRTVSLLSRIADYGLDYSQRTNKIAHHIVAETTPACGPAALMASPGVMRTQWDGQCETLATGPNLPQLASSPEVCESWERIAGDAGWGGVVANAWMQPSNKPTWIVFSEEQSSQMLNLIAESIAILPPPKRWQATFSTYVTTLPPDIDCRVRCVVAGSEEARMAAARGTVIDLTRPLGSPAAGAHVEAARNGTLIGLPGASGKLPPGIPTSNNLADQLLDESESSEYANSDSNDDFDVDNPFGALDRIPPDISARPHKSKSARREWEANASNKPRRSKTKLYVIAGVIGILFGLLGAGGTYVYLQTKQLSELVTEETSVLHTPEQVVNQNNEKQVIEKAPGSESQNDERSPPVDSKDNDETTLNPTSKSKEPPQENDKGSPATPPIKITKDMFSISTKITLGENIELTNAVIGSVIHADLKYLNENLVNTEDFSIKPSLVWQRKSPDSDWKDIPGEIDNRYVVKKEDVGNHLQCKVVINSDPAITILAEEPIQAISTAIAKISLREIAESSKLKEVQVICDLQAPYAKDKYAPIYFETTPAQTGTSLQTININCSASQILGVSEYIEFEAIAEGLRSTRKRLLQNKEQLLKCWNPIEIKHNKVFQYLKQNVDLPSTQSPDDSFLKDWNTILEEMRNVWNTSEQKDSDEKSEAIKSHMISINKRTERFRKAKDAPLEKEDVLFFLYRWEGKAIKDPKPSYLFSEFISSSKSFESEVTRVSKLNPRFVSKGAVCLFRKPRESEGGLANENMLARNRDFDKRNSFPFLLELCFSDHQGSEKEVNNVQKSPPNKQITPKKSGPSKPGSNSPPSSEAMTGVE